MPMRLRPPPAAGEPARAADLLREALGLRARRSMPREAPATCARALRYAIELATTPLVGELAAELAATDDGAPAALDVLGAHAAPRRGAPSSPSGSATLERAIDLLPRAPTASSTPRACSRPRAATARPAGCSSASLDLAAGDERAPRPSSRSAASSRAAARTPEAARQLQEARATTPALARRGAAPPGRRRSPRWAFATARATSLLELRRARSDAAGRPRRRTCATLARRRRRAQTERATAS